MWLCFSHQRTPCGRLQYWANVHVKSNMSIVRAHVSILFLLKRKEADYFFHKFQGRAELCAHVTARKSCTPLKNERPCAATLQGGSVRERSVDLHQSTRCFCGRVGRCRAFIHLYSAQVSPPISFQSWGAASCSARRTVMTEATVE